MSNDMGGIFIAAAMGKSQRKMYLKSSFLNYFKIPHKEG